MPNHTLQSGRPDPQHLQAKCTTDPNIEPFLCVTRPRDTGLQTQPLDITGPTKTSDSRRRATVQWGVVPHESPGVQQRGKEVNLKDPRRDSSHKRNGPWKAINGRPFLSNSVVLLEEQISPLPQTQEGETTSGSLRIHRRKPEECHKWVSKAVYAPSSPSPASIPDPNSNTYPTHATT